MGLAANQARLNVLTARKADLEYRLLTISNQTQQLAVKEAAVIAKKTTAFNLFSQANSNKSEDEQVSFENTAAYAEYETAMAELEVADLMLTQQQKAAETENQAVNAEREEIKKLVENNTKDSFEYFN